MKKTLRALVVEDNDDDFQLLGRALDQAGYQATCGRVQTAEAMRAALPRGWDIVLSDYSMPGFGAMGALAVLQESGLDLPFIVISGTIGEETAVEALKAGADDFFVKTRLARLGPAIERELREAAVRKERRRAEQALRESEVKFRRIVETAQEGIWLVDGEGRTSYLNQRMAELLGAPPQELLGASVFEFLDEEWNVQRTERQEEVVQKHGVKIRRRDGSEFWASLSTNTTEAGTLAMVTDVTEQRKLQEQLMVSDRMASVGTLAAGVAHEINNPLAAVLANLDLALMRTAEGVRPPLDLREIREELADAKTSAERMRHIVRDLKVFSRMEEEKREPVDLHQVLESAMRMTWNEIRHRATLKKDLRPVPRVEANSSRLGQVFLNLMVNAAQAIPEGNAKANEIRVSAGSDARGWAVAEVSDTGQGILPEVMKRLFSPFVTTKPIGIGTGLGLSICHRIITSLGGEIQVESAPGKGATFRVLLPPARAVVVEAPEPPPAAPLAGRRGQVLIVDDEWVVAKALQRSLEGQHEVTMTTSAREALDKIVAGARFDVILCDLMMPEMTGMELHAQLLAAAPDQAARMIFLTGGAFTPRARDFMATVPNLQVQKPFDLFALQALVAKWLR